MRQSTTIIAVLLVYVLCLLPIKAWRLPSHGNVTALHSVVHNESSVTWMRRHNASAEGRATNAPCQCEANNPIWQPTSRSIPKCIFIDLGAANANSFQQFLKGDYGPLSGCPSGQWEAFLVEANPQFNDALDWAVWKYPGMVHAHSATAAYVCDGSTSFSIDPDAANNHWGSSMKKSFGGSQVTVPTLNVIQLVAEQAKQADWVILKVDIEGAEYDLIPCLSQSSHAGLVDRIYVEEHQYLQGSSVYTPQQYEAAKVALRGLGVDVQDGYFSHTM